MSGEPTANRTERPELSVEYERFKQEFLQRLEAKKLKRNAEPVFWDKYRLKSNGERLHLDADQHKDRRLVSVDARQWQAVVKSADEALLAYDPEYIGSQEKLNRAAEGNDSEAYERHFKKLALLDAERRSQPNWMDEPSFTQAVRMACKDADGDFFISLVRRVCHRLIGSSLASFLESRFPKSKADTRGTGCTEGMAY